MIQVQRLKIALQKKGRLNEDSIELLRQCGLQFHMSKNSLLCHCENLPIDLLLVRDDDIPSMIMDGICQLGIVGENALLEILSRRENPAYELVKKLGFSKCRLSIAVPEEKSIDSLNELENKRIATSYPNLLQELLVKENMDASIINISGSVEIAPRLGMADAICDLVSTGRTLEENNLKEFIKVMDSEAVLIRSMTNLNEEQQNTYDLLLSRIGGALKARDSKYIMLHAPKEKLEEISALLPGCEEPTILPLNHSDDRVAVHAVAPEGVFWDTLEKLKKQGAQSILVLPIEKML